MSTPATAGEVATLVADQPPPLVFEQGDDDPFGAYTPIIRSLFNSGHPRWGFVVYRVYYDDEEAWQRFKAILHRFTDNQIRRMKKDRLLPYLSWTLMDDRAVLEGASKDVVRDAFRVWTANRSVKRDGPGADDPKIAEKSPRYRACLYIDKEVMESVSVTEFPSTFVPTGVILKAVGKVVLIDAEHGIELIPAPGITVYDLEEIASGYLEWEDLEEEEYSPIEGKTTFDVGWQYVGLEDVISVYEALCGSRYAWIDEHFYERPPAVWKGY